MKKPWAIGLISIVPGLGLVILGEAGRGLGAFVLTTLFLAGTFVPGETVPATSFAFFLIAWIVQGYYAVVIAQRLLRAQAGLALPERPVSITLPPPGASSAQKASHKAKVTVLKLLPPGDQLKLALQATTGMASTGEALLDLAGAASGVPPTHREIRQVYLGITPHDLVLVKTDAFGAPSELKRIPLARVSLVKAAEGLLSDELVVDLGEAKPLHVGIGKAFREATRELIGLLSQPKAS
jgi:hypothetical protein